MNNSVKDLWFSPAYDQNNWPWFLVERRRQEMVDLWTNQNAEKQYEKSLAAERKASDLRNIELEKEKLEIERELENRKRIEKQNILKAELQQQIQELSKSSLIC